MLFVVETGLYSSSSLLLSVGLISESVLPCCFGIVISMCGWCNQIAQSFHYFIDCANGCICHCTDSLCNLRSFF